MLSKSCTYGIWAVLYLASVKNEEYVPIREISNALNIPFHFLTKILQLLAKAKIVESLRGAHGGVQLNKPSEQITLREVIVAIDGTGLFEDCAFGLSECGDENPCPVHSKWTNVRNEIKRICEQTDFDDLSQQAHEAKWINSGFIPGINKVLSTGKE